MTSPVSALFDGRAMLAPMLATTDIPFRAVCRAFGVGLTATEMVSAKGIVEGSRESYRCATFGEEELPIAVQLAAASPGHATAAIRELLHHRPSVFDINCGCPNDRVCEAGAGSSLLDHPQTLGSIVRACAEASTVPVSAKIRLGGLKKENNVRLLVRVIEDAGAAFITVHARPRAAAYDEPAAWDGIAIAKDEAHIPVVGNGDIFSAADAMAMREHTGCDAVMVGRGALGTPWIFRDIAEGRRCGIAEHIPSAEEIATLVHSHLAQLRREYGDILALPRIRKHALWYARLYRDNDTLRHELFSREDTAFVLDRIDGFFSSHPVLIDTDSDESLKAERAFRRRILYWIP